MDFGCFRVFQKTGVFGTIIQITKSTMMKSPPKKPTGDIGVIVIDPGKGTVTYDPVKFPVTKVEIEEFIVKPFIHSGRSSGLFNFQLKGDPIRNELDDFDFTLPTKGGKKYLELMEVAPLEHIQGTYENAPNSYNEFDFAKYIYQKIIGKSNRYRGSTEIDINLLIYVTHWTFVLSKNIIALLQYWTLQDEHCFKDIFYFSHLSPTEGITSVIYPTDKELFKDFDENLYRDNQAVLLTQDLLKSGGS